MRTKKNLLAVAAVLVCCIVGLWFSTSIQGGERTYEIHPQLTVPYGYTPTMDTYPLIGLIERLVVQNQEITQNQLSQMDKNIKDVGKKLDSINAKLKKLSAKMARIEKALGIKQPKSQPKPAQKEAHKKSSPPAKN